ncbi:solute carrier family 52, riboflavin transporter, member 3-A-like isoform X2 [Anneissia japonica]|uniref:solute carrier family 52, riboflavin transporter, member 3-A-like isoform X2 n=1 Tax=Anneissia japonica TaxID=1529436 RepID=UPI001425AF7D|nr:solute carrier family 52, riboflavin transporter, member 3-A-like isoform X2 [Anneissia japonica]
MNVLGKVGSFALSKRCQRFMVQKTSSSLSTLLLIFFWDTTSYWIVDNQEHSTAMLLLTLVMAAVACTTPVTYIPFMSRFPGRYLMYFFVGEGLSALLPSMVALMQGVGEQPQCVPLSEVYSNTTTEGNITVLLECRDWEIEYPQARFSTEVFFSFLFVMTFCSSISFLLLNYLPIAKQEQLKSVNSEDAAPKKEERTSTYMLRNGTSADRDPDVKEQETSLMSRRNNGDQPTEEFQAVSPDDDITSDGDEATQEVKTVNLDDPDVKTVNLPFGLLGRRCVIYLLVLLGWVNALGNSVLPAIQTYSCGPYGMKTFHLAAALDNIVMPIMYLAASFKMFSSILLVSVLTFLVTITGAYCMLTAALSPSPPLQFSAAGDVIVILAWMCTAGLFCYVKATIGGIMRSQPNNRLLLLWFGIVTQIGSFVGAVVMFPLVNVFNVFEEYYEDPCAGVDLCVESIKLL